MMKACQRAPRRTGTRGKVEPPSRRQSASGLKDHRSQTVEEALPKLVTSSAASAILSARRARWGVRKGVVVRRWPSSTRP